MNTHQESDLQQTGKHWINGEWVHSATVAKARKPFHRGGSRAVRGGRANRSGGPQTERREKSLHET